MSLYDLSSVRVPALRGTPLDLFAKTLEKPRLRSLLIDRLLTQGGMDRLRALEISAPPTAHPPLTSDRPIPQDGSVEALTTGSTEGFLKDAPLKTIADFHQAYKDGLTDPMQVAEALLSRAQGLRSRKKPSVLFIAQDEGDVMRQAHASKLRWANGHPLGPLDGVPVAVKDEMDQAPYPTTVGTRFLGKRAATTSATLVARLRSAGALLVGKANMHEIGINPNGANPNYGLVRNPYKIDHDPGGSSSGSAATVAEGLCPLAIGADGGGSIRIPAALCGMVGLKATFGRISEHGVAPVCWSVAHAGPIGATVADVALGYATIAGPDPEDPMTHGQPPVSLADWLKDDLTGLKVGVFTPWFKHASENVVAGARAGLEPLYEAGAQAMEIEIPELDAIRVAHAATILSEMATAHRKYPLSDFAPHVRVSLAIGQSLSSTDYIQAQRMRTQALRHMKQVFDQVDLIVTPATAITAPKIPVEGPNDAWSDLSSVTEVMRYAFLANLTGHPALTLPVGYDPAGLPVGLQIMGRHWEEHLVLRAARVIERRIARRAPPGAKPLWAA